jgi:hypothetical protein
MKLSLFFLISIFIIPAAAQVESLTENYFPSEYEFSELHITSDKVFEDPAALSKVKDASLILDVGFSRYARRKYSTGTASSLTIEAITLTDSRAAYSLLSLLRTAPIQNGPPGDAFAMDSKGMIFAQKKECIRIQAEGIPAELLKKVAISVSNRIGQRKDRTPSLISHFPKLGYDASSLRYFPGIKSYEDYTGSRVPDFVKPDLDMEIAQAKYSLENHSGTLFLLDFPTPQIAEAYLEELAIPASDQVNRPTLHAKRSGPLVGFLAGNFDALTANKILGSIKYSYAVRWVYEKSNQPKILWGIPARILVTVVNSLFFVILLIGISLLIGVIVAVFRFYRREHAMKDLPISEQSPEITKLRLE